LHEYRLQVDDADVGLVFEPRVRSVNQTFVGLVDTVRADVPQLWSHVLYTFTAQCQLLSKYYNTLDNHVAYYYSQAPISFTHYGDQLRFWVLTAGGE